MSAATVLCHVLNGEVTVVSDLQGNVTNVICPMFDRLTFHCAIKIQGKGAVGLGISRIADRLSGTKIVVCEFADASNSTSARISKHLTGG